MKRVWDVLYRNGIDVVLRPVGYSWDFVSVDGSVLDRGDQQCHAAPPSI